MEAGFCDIEELAARFKSGKIDHSVSQEEVEHTQTSLVQWYHLERRALPWRGDSFEAIEASRSRSTGAGAAVKAAATADADAPPDADADADDDDEAPEAQGDVLASTDPHTSAEEPFVTPPPSAYGTWVSEIMLQQTRVETVVPYWYRWMRKYPTIEALAAASAEEVNASWAGLGYYRRARQLHEAAQQLVAQAEAMGSGRPAALPSTAEGLRKVPGIGAYTAGAISSIALGLVEPLVDGNVHRVFSRLRMLRCELGSKDMETRSWDLAKRLVHPGDPGAFNQGLMELGATVCKPTNPRCGVCPLRAVCQARQLLQAPRAPSASRAEAEAEGESSAAIAGAGVVAGADGLGADGLPVDLSYFPVRAPKKRPREVLLSVGVFARLSQDGATRYLLVKRKDSGLLQGQWEFPNVLLWEEAAPARGGKGKVKVASKASKAKGAKGKSTSTSPSESEVVVDADGDTSVAQLPLFASRDDIPEGDFQQVSAMRALLRRSCGCAWHEKGETAPVDAAATPSVQYVLSLREAVKVEEGVCDTVDTPAAAAIEPIVHIFSHQRHTMHVSETLVQCIEVGGASHAGPEVRWMSADELCSEGVTSGCKKVLAAVQKRAKPKAKPKPAASSTAKRKAAADGPEVASEKAPVKKRVSAAAAAAAATPSISSFFAKR